VILVVTLALTAAAAVLPGQPAQLAEVLTAAELCVDAAGKRRADSGRLEQDGWSRAAGEESFVFAKSGSAARIELVADGDGQRRTCTVHAILPADQMVPLRKSVSAAFKAKAFEQSSNDHIWLFRRAGTRGIQMRAEPAGDGYRVQLIAAEF
jgi:hypothetical protein